MDASDINRLLSADHYSPADLEQVQKLCRNYPMFNLGHMLKVRVREALGHEKDADLKVAAVYASDRRKLFELVSKVATPGTGKEEPPAEAPDGIHFSDEPHREADLIIEQHAPYAGSETDETLFELDKEMEDSFELDQESDLAGDTEPDQEISSETLIEAVAKDEIELEDSESEDSETPSIILVESDEESAPGSDPAPDAEPSTNNRLILNFLNGDPGPIRPEKEAGARKDVSLASVREHDGFITDTLARIYVKQGLYAKAIYAYEKLSLKYPEKSAYFAAQIEKIRNINHS